VRKLLEQIVVLRFLTRGPVKSQVIEHVLSDRSEAQLGDAREQSGAELPRCDQIDRVAHPTEHQYPSNGEMPCAHRAEMPTFRRVRDEEIKPIAAGIRHHSQATGNVEPSVADDQYGRSRVSRGPRTLWVAAVERHERRGIGIADLS